MEKQAEINQRPHFLGTRIDKEIWKEYYSNGRMMCMVSYIKGNVVFEGECVRYEYMHTLWANEYTEGYFKNVTNNSAVVVSFWKDSMNLCSCQFLASGVKEGEQVGTIW